LADNKLICMYDLLNKTTKRPLINKARINKFKRWIKMGA